MEVEWDDDDDSLDPFLPYENSYELDIGELEMCNVVGANVSPDAVPSNLYGSVKTDDEFLAQFKLDQGDYTS